MNRTIVIGIVGVVVVLIALGLNYWLSIEEQPSPTTVATTPAEPELSPSPAPESQAQPIPEAGTETESVPEASPEPRPAETPVREPEQTAEPEPQNGPSPAPLPADEPEPQQDEEAQPQPEASETQTAEPAVPSAAPEEAPAPQVVRPEFDVVRVTPTGDIVVAGRAEAGSVVTVYDDGRPIGQIKADSRGEWVMLPDEPLPPGSRELSLSSRLGDGDLVWSENVVVIVVPEVGLDVAGRPSEESSGALVVEVPRSGFGTSDVLQQPPAQEAEPLPAGSEVELSVDVLDYDEQGNLGLSGHANAESDVLVYLDNELLAAAPATPGGVWRLVVKRQVEPGLYTMRVDEVSEGDVIARLEFPFQRADPSEIETGPLLVVVQPGNSLWRLARRTLGEGTRYTVIFQANRDRIRDPDLIYPGQVFVVPRTN